MGLPMELFWTYMLTGFATVAVGTVMVSTLIYSRLIARVALVRQRPAGQPNAQPREFIRFSTNLGQMAGRKPRELPVDKFRTYVIMGEKKGGVRSKSRFVPSDTRSLPVYQGRSRHPAQQCRACSDVGLFAVSSRLPRDSWAGQPGG